MLLGIHVVELLNAHFTFERNFQTSSYDRLKDTGYKVHCHAMIVCNYIYIYYVIVAVHVHYPHACSITG